MTSSVAVTKNVKTVVMAAIGAAILIVIIVFARDLILRRHGTFDCGDGPRRSVDIRDFTTQYSAYSVELEASVAEKAKISTKLNPVQLQQLSEAMQQAQEFRKYLVAGYNSCAVTKAHYEQYGTRFQALDSLARRIDEVAAKPSLAPDESASLAALVSQYGELARRLGTE